MFNFESMFTNAILYWICTKVRWVIEFIFFFSLGGGGALCVEITVAVWTEINFFSLLTPPRGPRGPRGFKNVSTFTELVIGGLVQ